MLNIHNMTKYFADSLGVHQNTWILDTTDFFGIEIRRNPPRRKPMDAEHTTGLECSIPNRKKKAQTLQVHPSSTRMCGSTGSTLKSWENIHLFMGAWTVYKQIGKKMDIMSEVQLNRGAVETGRKNSVAKAKVPPQQNRKLWKLNTLVTLVLFLSFYLFSHGLPTHCNEYVQKMQPHRYIEGVFCHLGTT